jgi:hypothetical protein
MPAPQVAPSPGAGPAKGRTSMSEKERVKMINANANKSPSNTPVSNSRSVNSANPMRSPSSYFRTDPEKKKVLDKLDTLLDSFNIQALLGFALIISLFLTDICILVNLDADFTPIVDGVMIVIFVAFVIECVALVIAKEKYFLGFFFWMDVLGECSCNNSVIIILANVRNNFITRTFSPPPTPTPTRFARTQAPSP